MTVETNRLVGQPRGGLPLLSGAILAAFVIWYFLFAVAGTPFWVVIAAATFVLGGGTLIVYRDTLNGARRTWTAFAILGVVSAVLLYGIFAIGNEAVRAILATGAQQVENVYATKAQAQPMLIGLLLLFIIGPGEELFWRGWVQRSLMAKLGPFRGFVVTTLIYIAIHIPAMNLTLVGASAVAGAFWGWMYLRYNHIGPGLVSHALWDVSVFILFPFQ